MFDFIVSLLYPKKCVRCKKHGAFICDNCLVTIQFLEYQVCAACQKGSIDGLTHPKCLTKYGLNGVLSAVTYKGIVKKLIYQFKYPPYLSALKADLGKLLYEGIIQQESFMSFISQKDVYIASVPLHAMRLNKRGYNQSELLAKELSKRLGVGNMQNLLIRKINTKPQFDLKKGERGRNVVGAFALNHKFKDVIRGKNIIVVDDILTTGSTIRECGKVLKQSGAKRVLGVTLAHESN